MLLGTCRKREADDHFIRHLPAGRGVIAPSRVTCVELASCVSSLEMQWVPKDGGAGPTVAAEQRGRLACGP